MFAYIFKRVLLMIPTLFGVLLMTFVVIQFVPGGPVEQMVAQLQGRDTGGEGAAAAGSGYRGRQGVDAARIAEIKTLYGFDKPPTERFWMMLKQFVQFDLGKSFFYPKDVWSLIKEKLPVSISLGLWTFFLSYLVSVPLGIAKAVRAGSRFDTLTSLLVLLGYELGCQSGRLFMAHHLTGHGQRVGILCRHHHADQERVSGRNPQAIRPDRPRQRVE
jgi:microcin C transport system permease protein